MISSRSVDVISSSPSPPSASVDLCVASSITVTGSLTFLSV
uniref:Uncharacterized protein n=1 Tax=Manihot esculenta TaxID=3983 RepID=A0A2C9UNB0_MANES